MIFRVSDSGRSATSVSAAAAALSISDHVVQGDDVDDLLLPDRTV